MPDSKHELVIVTKAKDLASKPLASIGKAGQKAGKQAASGMGKASNAAKVTTKSFTEAGAAGSKAAGLAGAGFAGAAAGISLATASAESFEGAAVGAAASVASGFASGGPAGAAIALAGVGLGLLVREIKSAGEEYKALGDKATKAGQASAAAATQAEAATAALRKEVSLLNAEYRVRATGADFDKEAASRALTLVELEGKRAKAVEKTNRLTKEAMRLSRLASSIDGDTGISSGGVFNLANSLAKEEAQNASRKYTDAALLAEKEAEQLERQISTLKEKEESKRRIAELDKIAIENAQIIKERQEQQLELAREMEEISRREEQLWDDITSTMERLTPEFEKQTEELGAHLDLYKRLIEEGYQREAEELKKAIASQKERKKLADEHRKAEQDVTRALEKQRQEAERFNRTKEQTIESVRKEIELLDARDDAERQSILNERERQDLIAKGVSEHDIETLQSARRAKTAREAADAAGDEADNLERAAKASGKVQAGGSSRSRGGHKSFNNKRATFGAQFTFGSRGGPKKSKLDEEGRPALPGGFQYTTKDEQAADTRRMEKDFGIQRNDQGQKIGFATGKPIEGAEKLGQAADGTEKIAEAQSKTAEATDRLAQGIEKAIPPTEQISTGIDSAAQSFTTLASSIDTNSSSVDKFASQVESTSTTTAQAVERTANKLDRLIAQLAAAQIISGGV